MSNRTRVDRLKQKIIKNHIRETKSSIGSNRAKAFSKKLLLLRELRKEEESTGNTYRNEQHLLDHVLKEFMAPQQQSQQTS